MKKRFVLLLAIFALLVVPTMSVAAAGEVEPADPGAGSSQDASLRKTLEWVIQQPLALSLSAIDSAKTIDLACLDAIARGTGSYGYLPFAGFDALHTGLNNSGGVVVSGFSGGVGGVKACIPPSAQCTSSVTPGIITLTARKNSPTNPVVVAQDPNRSGVNLTWTLNIFPDIYTYGIWTVDPLPDDGKCKHENAECQINNSNKACCPGLKCIPNNPNSGNGKCRVDPSYHRTYSCVDHYEVFRNDFATLTPKAVLTTASRSWILNDLAKVYPGTFLKHPDWGFQATERCVWSGDTCVWTHTESGVQVADPGYYDLMLTGRTVGTYVTPARNFSLTGGQFSVNLVETSLTNHS